MSRWSQCLRWGNIGLEFVKTKAIEFGSLDAKQKWQRIRIPAIALGLGTVFLMVGPYFLPPKIRVSFPGNNSVENPLDQKIEIIFDRGMTRGLTQNSFSITPKVSGSFAWESNQKLVFTPDKPLERGKKYEINFKGLALSSFGSPLLSNKKIEFSTLGEPKVAVYSPVSEAIENLAPIMVVFDRPMIPLTTATNSALKKPAFKISPTIAGEGRWLGTTAYQFLPTEPFLKSTTYTVTIDKGMNSMDGGILTEGFSWQFSSMRPRVVRVSPNNDDAYASPIASVSATFNQKLNTASAMSHFKVFDESQKEIPGQIRVNGQTIGFYASSPLQREKTYKATILTGLAGQEGPNGMDQDYNWSFKMAAFPEVVGSTPKSGDKNIFEENSISVMFKTPMDEDSFTNNITIDPTPDTKPGLYFSSYRNENTLNIGTYMQRSAKYTVTVGAGAKDQYGVSLGKPYIFSFTTAPYTPDVSLVPFGTYFATFNQQIVPRIVSQVTNTDKVDYTLYKLNKDDFINLYRRRYTNFCGSNYNCSNWQDFNPGSLEKVKNWTEVFEKNENVPINVVTKVTSANGSNLPSGLYFLDARIQSGSHDNMVMIVSNSTMTVKKSNQQIFAWVVNQSNGDVIPDMNMEMRDGDGGRMTSGKTNQDGVWQQDINLDKINNLLIFGQKDGDVLVAASNWGSGINRYDFGLPSYYSYRESVDYQNSSNRFKLFLTVDRPIYRPGQKVYFKGVIKKDNDAAYANLPTGEQVEMNISDSMGRKIYSKSLPINSFGSFSDDFVISQEADLGYYQMSASYSKNSITQEFQVEEYRRPDMKMSISANKEYYINGDVPEITINASYYFGAPIANAKVSWSLSTQDDWWSWDKDFRFEFGDPENYWSRWWGGSYSASNNIMEGKGVTDSEGNLVLRLPVDMGKYKSSQKLTLDASVEDLSNQSAGGSIEYVMHKGGIYVGLHPQSYGGKSGQEQKIDVVTIGANKVEANNTQVTMEFYKRTWDTIRELDTSSGEYMYVSKPHDTLVASNNVTTNEFGQTTTSFTPSEGGTYRILGKVVDDKGNMTTTSDYMWVSGYGYVTQRQNNDRILVIPDKKNYDVGETASLFVDTPFASGSAKTLLTVERAKVISYRVTNTDETSNNFPISIEPNFAPNVYLGAVLVRGGNLVNDPPEMKVGYVEVKVTDKKQKLAVDIQTDKKRYKPGETMQATVTTRDLLGHPVSADVALGLVDKAVWDLSEISLPDIYEFFYQPRNLEVDTSQLLSISMDRINANTNLGAKGGSGGCFTGETPILIPGGLTKPIADFKPGDTVLTKANESSMELIPAKVIAVFKHSVDRYLILNGELRVTPVHMMYVNNTWKTAGQIRVGDVLLDRNNKFVTVNSVEQVFGKDIEVYNLEVEKYHTYFARDIYVHNQKGGGPDTARKDFPETAYWNPSLLTGADGKAVVSIKLPDNLTTWRLAAIADTKDSAFGSVATEFLVNRDIMIRPIVPRFLSVGDQAQLGAIVVNTSGSDLTVNANLIGSGFAIANNSTQTSSVGNGQQIKFLWPTTTSSTTAAELKFSVSDSTGNFKDGLVLTLPVKSYSVPEVVATAGQANDTAQETVNLPLEVDRERGQADLVISANIGGGSIEAMNYLFEYPYFCTEQTTSRIIPAAYSYQILKQAKIDLINGISQNKLKLMIDDGVQRLNSSQHTDGGWSWWITGESDPTMSAYAYIGLTEAKKNGFSVADKTIEGAKKYLVATLAHPRVAMSLEQQAFIQYAVKDSGVNLAAYASNLYMRRFEMNIEARAYLAMVLQKSGQTTQATNLYHEVVSLAKKTATSTHFENSSGRYWYGGANTTTAVALEMILAFEPKHPYIPELVKYLMASRTDNHWGSTQETATVVKAIAMQMISAGNKSNNENYKLEVNKVETKNGKFGAADVFKVEKYSTPISSLLVGQENTFRLSKSGTGNLYYNFNLRYFLPFSEIKALDQGLVIERDLIDDKGKVLPKDKVREGTELWVRLTVVTPALRQYVAIEDILPAGFESVNESLKNVVSLNKEPVKANDEWWYFDNKEYRDDRTTLFARYLPAGIYEVAYRVRATTPGKYHYMPAQAYEMYFPDVSGHSDGGWLTVTAK